MSTAWFTHALVPWYRDHKRPLPWRRTIDPYAVWLSEVILQQTRVDQGMAYWQRFMERFPRVEQLAAASEDEVLRLWQGLGYYSRARNLLTAARQVVERHGGRFPPTHAELLQLKGVGDYTAAAIASICFDLPEAVVDGNVYRVLARVFGIATPIDSTAGRKEFRALASQLIDPATPGDHNQAVMELGATVCVPVRPRCSACPLADRCLALAQDRIDALPVKAGRATVRERHFNYLHVEVGNGLYMQQRGAGDIWQGLWELPLLETEAALGPRSFHKLAGKLPAGTKGGEWTVVEQLGPVKHVLSHQHLIARFWRVVPPADLSPPTGWRAVDKNTLTQLAVPRLLDRYLSAVVCANGRLV
ncbi:MAG: A/G-specific adenine glycosylase [Flavobacteriales bacterium]